MDIVPWTKFDSLHPREHVSQVRCKLVLGFGEDLFSKIATFVTISPLEKVWPLQQI